MATGWGSLGEVLGGGIDRAGAFEQGRLRTAQTEGALAQARNRQLESVSLELKNKARMGFEDAQIKAGMDPSQAKVLASVVLGESGADYSAGMKGLETQQEMGFRDTLANPEAPMDDRFAAGAGVQGKLLSPYEVSGNVFADVRNPDAGLEATPLGEAMIGTQEATTELRNVQAGDPDYTTVSGGGGGKAPSGYKVNPDYNPELPPGPTNQELLPLTGGPADPSAPAKLGTRERQVIARVFTAATNTAKDLENIMAMPSGATAGYLGSGMGATPGTGLLEAGWNDLKNRVSREETDIYNATLGGLSNALMTLERQGLQGTGALEAQYDRLALVPTDTIQQKMYKMALIRQTVESALESNIAMGTVNGDLLAYAKELQAQVQRAVPFAPSDVIALVNEGAAGGKTLGDVIAARRGVSEERTLGGQAIPPPNPRGQELPPTNDKGWTLLEDAEGNLAYVSPDGREIEEVQ